MDKTQAAQQRTIRRPALGDEEKEATTNNNNMSSGDTKTEDPTTTASGADQENPETKPNWHSRKISWGKDMIFGEVTASSPAEAAHQSDSKRDNTAATAPTTTNSSTAAVAPTSSHQQDQQHQQQHQQPQSVLRPSTIEEETELLEEETDPDVLKAQHIQSLFAGRQSFVGGSGADKRRNISSFSQIDLDDILKESPYESEAEAYILKAIEDREARAGGETDPSILDNINDDAISALSRSSHEEEEDDDLSDEHPPSRTNNSNSQLGLSNRSPQTRRTSISSPQRGGGGQQQSNSTTSPNRGKRGDHRRNQTMEAQLFGLASAIDAIQAQNWDSSEEHWMPAASTSPLGDAGLLSSAETLQHNATLLYNRGNKNRNRLDSGFLSSGGGITTAEDESSTGGTQRSPAGGGAENSQSTGRRRRASLMSLQGLGKSFRNIKKTDGDDVSNEDSAAMGGSKSSFSFRNPNRGSDIDGSMPLTSLYLSDIEEGKEDTTNGVVSDEKKDNNSGDSDGNNGENFGEMGGSQEQPMAPKKDGRKKKVERQLVRELQDFFAPQKTSIILYLRVAFLYISVPLLGISILLFYLGDNPPTGRLAYAGKPVNGSLWNTDGDRVDPDKASIAWWLVFIVRLIVTFTLAKAMEKFFVDYLTIRSRGSINLFGPWITLLLLQSRGWPSTLFLWGITNFCFLSGSSDFVHHWAYWQDSIGLFNMENPSGHVVDSEWNHRILAIAVAVGIISAFKRLLLGLYLGKRTFNAYADQLAKVMKNILMISEVAALAKDFEREMKIRASRKGVTGNQYVAHLRAQRDKLFGIFDDIDDEGISGNEGFSVADRSSAKGDVDHIVDSEDRNPWSGALSNAQQMRIIQLLGAWEEPVIAERKVETISVSALLQFRRSMACLHTLFPFSGSFGLADTRENCIQSAQDVYRRLLLNDPDESNLNFETLALLGLQRDGTLNQSKLKEMIRLFRPNRDGSLSILEFVKSIDSVYREIRMLRASVINASKIDKSFEAIFNFIFYAVIIVIIMSQLGYSPMAMFLSISGVILAFAFMIGSASSKYFEGILFILVRRPYAIGDGIYVGNVDSQGLFAGHPFWYVEDVTLFTTSVLYFYTNERATLSNGSLANSRIINCTRSAGAGMYTLLKFPIDVSHEKLKIFNTALEQFFRNRPREWRSYDSFRATQVDAEAGFIEFMVVCTHRLSFVHWTSVHESKAEVIQFCSELAKKLDIWYRAPPVPVDLTFKNSMPFGAMPQLQQQQQLQPQQGNMVTTADTPGTILNAANHTPNTASQGGGDGPDLSGLQAMFPSRF